MEPRLPRSGPALDLACGSGRDATFLALRGRRVLGVDLLPDALCQARAVARASGVLGPDRAGFHRCDLRDPAAARRVLRPGRFSVVVCFRYLQRDLFPLMEQTLSPGGWLLFETFLTRQAETGRKPRNPAYLLQPGELKRSFPGLRIVEYREGRDDEGNWTASLAARRPRRWAAKGGIHRASRTSSAP